MTPHLIGPALLFAPAHRAELIPKAYERADTVIVDLEDGAGAGDRAAMHDNLRTAGLDLPRTILRTIGPEAEGFASDVGLARELGIGTVMVPKVHDCLPVELAGLDVIAMIETPQALVNIREIAAQDGVVGLFWGAEDLIALLGGTHSRRLSDEDRPGDYRDVIRHARSQVLVHAAAAGKFAVDAMYADFRDPDAARGMLAAAHQKWRETLAERRAAVDETRLSPTQRLHRSRWCAGPSDRSRTRWSGLAGSSTARGGTPGPSRWTA